MSMTDPIADFLARIRNAILARQAEVLAPSSKLKQRLCVVLKDEGLADLLPRCNTVILDEAHQLPETATLFFGEEVTAGQLGELARDAEVEGLKSARDYAPRLRAGLPARQEVSFFPLQIWPRRRAALQHPELSIGCD